MGVLVRYRHIGEIKMITTMPCKNCCDRKTGCHGVCQKYIEAMKKRNEEKQAIRKMKKVDSQVYGYLAARKPVNNPVVVLKTANDKHTGVEPL